MNRWSAATAALCALSVVSFSFMSPASSQTWSSGSAYSSRRICSYPTATGCAAAPNDLPPVRSASDRAATALIAGVGQIPGAYLNAAFAVTPRRPHQPGGWFEWRFANRNGTISPADPGYSRPHSHGQAIIHLSNSRGARFLLDCTVRATALAMRRASGVAVSEGVDQIRTVSVVTAVNEDHIDLFSANDQGWWFYGCWVTRLQ